MPERTSYAAGEPAWTDLMTADVPAAATYYGTIFGWQAEPVADPNAGGYTMVTLDGRYVGALSPQQPGDTGPARWSVYVATDDIDRTLEVAKVGGGTVMMPVLDVMGAGRMAIVADPAGAAISLWEAGEHGGAAVMDEPGALTWVELTTTDTASAKEFYGSVFGWGEETSESLGLAYTEFKLGGKSVAGMMAAQGDAPASYWLPYFQAADIDRVFGEAVALGGTALVPVADLPGAAGRFAILTDPQGAAFGLFQP